MHKSLIKQIKSCFDVDDNVKDSKGLSLLLAETRPEDLAQILSEFKEKELNNIIRHMDDHTTALVLDETDPQTQEDLLDQFDNETLSQLIELMPPDEAADLLEALEKEDREQVLKQLKARYVKEIKKLLKYDSESAGGIMTPHVAKTTEDSTASKTLNLLQGIQEVEFINYIYVVDDQNHLKGVVSLRELLKSSPKTLIHDLMGKEVISVDVTTDQEEVARIVTKYNFQAIPVINKDNLLCGIITFDDVTDVMVEEASEDMYRISGISNVHPTKEPIIERFLKRIPWLLIPLFGEIIVAIIQSFFKFHIDNSTMVLLMLFTPIIIGMNGAVALQSSTTIVRGLATGEIEINHILRMATKEIIVGILIAVTCGFLCYLMVWTLISSSLIGIHLFPPWQVAITISTALIVGMTWGAATGTFVPLVCELIGVDPAFVAGPFTSTMNDVMGTSIYFITAIIILIKLA